MMRWNGEITYNAYIFELTASRSSGNSACSAALGRREVLRLKGIKHNSLQGLNYSRCIDKMDHGASIYKCLPTRHV